MPSRVVIVKRVRRRSFAILWAIPGWLGAAWSALRRESQASFVAPASDLPREIRVPNLRFESDGAHACTACGLCVELCPSGALALEVRAVAPDKRNGCSPGPADLTRFTLDLGGCIACGRCTEACPEQALGLEPMPRVALVGHAGLPLPIELLEPASARNLRVGA